MRNCVLIITCALLLLANSVEAQRFRNINTDAGLASAVAFHVVQDKDGYIWTGTTSGVCRYNGHTFKNYSTKKLIDTEVVLKFWPDDYGRFWGVGLNGRLLIIDDGELYPYQYNDTITALDPELNNDPRIYLDTATAVLHLYTNSGHITIDDLGHAEYVTKQGVAGTVMEARNGQLMIYATGTADSGLNLVADDKQLSWPGIRRSRLYYGHINANGYYGSNGKQLYWVDNNDSLHIKNYDNEIVYIAESQHNELLLAFYSGGLISVDKNLDPLDTLLRGVTPTSVMTDNNGGMWVSTMSEGLYYTQPSYTVPVRSHQQCAPTTWPSTTPCFGAAMRMASSCPCMVLRQAMFISSIQTFAQCRRFSRTRTSCRWWWQ